MFAYRLPPEEPFQGPHITHLNEEGGEKEEYKGQGVREFIDDGDEGKQRDDKDASQEEGGTNQNVNEQGEAAPKNSGKLKAKLNILRSRYPIMLGEYPWGPGWWVRGGGGLHGMSQQQKTVSWIWLNL